MGKRLLSICAALLMAGCATEGGRLDTTETARDGVALALGYQLYRPDMMTFGLAYLIYDPLAPNWDIEETRVSEDVFYVQLRMKPYHTGGEGESMVVLKRRAGQLQRELGYTGYRILDYSEGIESRSMAARRYGEGNIRLVRN